jgi:hypothetical protein
VDHGRRLADHGACVPWEALAAIERAQADAAARRTLAAHRGEGDEGGVRAGVARVRRWWSSGRDRLSAAWARGGRD